MLTNQAARSRSPIAAHPLTSAAIAILMAAVKAPAGTDETLPHQYTADPAPAPAPAPAGVGLRSGSE